MINIQFFSIGVLSIELFFYGLAIKECRHGRISYLGKGRHSHDIPYLILSSELLKAELRYRKINMGRSTPRNRPDHRATHVTPSVQRCDCHGTILRHDPDSPNAPLKVLGCRRNDRAQPDTAENTQHLFSVSLYNGSAA